MGDLQVKYKNVYPFGFVSKVNYYRLIWAEFRVYTLCPGRAKPNELNAILAPQWLDTYRSNLIITFGKNLSNFMFSVLSLNLTLFSSARPGHDV